MISYIGSVCVCVWIFVVVVADWPYLLKNLLDWFGVRWQLRSWGIYAQSTRPSWMPLFQTLHSELTDRLVELNITAQIQLPEEALQ